MVFVMDGIGGPIPGVTHGVSAIPKRLAVNWVQRGCERGLRKGKRIVPGKGSFMFQGQTAGREYRKVAEDVLHAGFFRFRRQMQMLLDARGDVL